MADTASERLYLGRIIPGMDVCDVTGEKVGSIARVHRRGDASATDRSDHAVDDIIEVKTGFLGFGKHYYVPLGAVQEVLSDSIFLSKSRSAFQELGYADKPAHLAQVH